MTNADDQTPPAVPPVPPTESPVTPAAETAPPSTPYAPPAAAEAPGYPAAPPTYTPASPQNPYATGVAAEPRGLAIASMIAGIAGVVFALFSFGFLPAVAGVVLGHIAQRKQPAARPFWLTGLITGYIGVAIGLLTGIFWLVLIIAAINSPSSGY